MKAYPTLRRWLAAGITAAVLAGVVVIGALSGRSGAGDKAAGPKKGPGTDAGWVMYGGSPFRNMVNTRVKGLPAEWDIGDPKRKVKSKNIKWVADLGSKAYGGPIVVAGKVIVGTNNQKPRNPKDFKVVDGKREPIDLGVIMCFDEKTGKFLWQTTFKKLPSGLVHDWPKEGICSTPVAEGDRIYYVSNRCEVVCSDLSGKIQWKLDMMGELGVFPHNLAVCSPLLVGDKLYVVTANGVDEDHLNVPSPKAPSFIRLDKRTGKVEWQDNRPSVALLKAPKKTDKAAMKDFFKKLVNEAKLLQHGQWSNPAYAVVQGKPQVIFPGGDGWIYSFDPDSGKLIWRFDCNPKDAQYQLGSKGNRSDFIATPVIHDNKVYIGVGQDPEHLTGVGHLWCIDMTREGDVSPELVTDSTVWPPKTKKNPNSAMVWHYGGVAPKKLGRNYYFGRTMSTCAIHDGLVYAAELGGILHCLDAATGKVFWTHDCKANTWSSPYWADGKIYLGTDGKEMLVFAHGKQKRLLETNDFDARVRAAPVAANGTLYVMTENKLYAIAGK
jgi:outer membrane protein assembly factor BamB